VRARRAVQRLCIQWCQARDHGIFLAALQRMQQRVRLALVDDVMPGIKRDCAIGVIDHLHDGMGIAEFGESEGAVCAVQHHIPTAGVLAVHGSDDGRIDHHRFLAQPFHQWQGTLPVVQFVRAQTGDFDDAQHRRGGGMSHDLSSCLAWCVGCRM
jgi:hypothetical protein